jgi:hypothetical protein
MEAMTNNTPSPMMNVRSGGPAGDIRSASLL